LAICKETLRAGIKASAAEQAVRLAGQSAQIAELRHVIEMRSTELK
jgi:hypothetical protein